MVFKDMFEKYNDQFTNFENVLDKFSNCPDVHAFILLDKLVPTECHKTIISASKNGIIYIAIDIQKMQEVISESQVIDLIRCGVMYDSDFDCLSMFI